MMNNSKHTLQSKEVHDLAIKTLLQLSLTAKSDKVQVVDLLNVVLFAAAFRTSINQACQALESAPHPTTVRNQLSEQLSDLDLLEVTINQMLACFLPKKFTKKGQTIAIDLVDLPYHGDVEPEHEGEVRRSKAKSGTTHFFSYATAYLIHKGQRYTLAILRVRSDQKMHLVVQRMIERLAQLRIRVTWYLLDRGFYSVKVMNLLMEKKFIIPVIKKGKKADSNGDATGTQAFAKIKSSRWERYTMRNQEGESVSFRVAVVCRNFNGKWNRNERETLLYATNLRWKKKPDWIRKWYRKRFGIESSYRQLNQARIKTSTRKPELRLLFVAVALLLRNVWVWLHREVIANRGGGHRQLIQDVLPLQMVLFWVLHEVLRLYSPRLEIDVSVELQEALNEHSPFLTG